MHRYFFDVTDIMRYIKTETSISGIQRVSLEIIKRMLHRYGAERVQLCYWDKRAQRYVTKDAGFLRDMDSFDADVLSVLFFGGKARSTQSIPPMLARYRNQPLKYRYHHIMASLQALRGNHRYFASRGTSIAKWKDAKTVPQASASPALQAQKQDKTDLDATIASGDRIIVLGATWGIGGLDDCLQRLVTDKGAQVSLMIHDLIPVITPEHIPEGLPLEFHRWLEQSTHYCQRYFANSEHTARDLAMFLNEIDVARDIKVIPLAQQVMQEVPEAAAEKTLKGHALRLRDLGSDILAVTKTPYVLVVGTMESRKNLWRLAQVWARLTQDRDIDAPRLVLAGKRNSDNSDFNALMEHSGNLGGWVQFADRPSDAALAYLYENCLFSATVSLYEGWGLPIGESLAFGKTAVVADNSSMPEVGGDLVEYCDAGSIDSIYRAVRKLIAEPDYRAALEARIKDSRLRTWDDVAGDFVAALEG